MDDVKTANRSIFIVSVLITGAIAGSFVWMLLFIMELGLELIWDRVPIYLGQLYPVIMCVIGGVIIGLFARHYGQYPEKLMSVMAKVKHTGRYEYKDLAPMSVAALLPMVFGGSIGPEAGLVGAIAAICTWVGDRLKRFGNDFQELTRAGTYAAISAIFTAPLYGFADAITGETVEGYDAPYVSKRMKFLIYALAIAGAFGAYMLLSNLIGGGMHMPQFTNIEYGLNEFLWLIPLALIGGVCGWSYCVLDKIMEHVGNSFGDKHVTKATIAGLLLGLCGVALPFTMFAGESQAIELQDTWITMTAATLIGTGIMKIVVTALCVNMGWRGGHFFPVIFSGISIGYGLSIIMDVDPIFCVCAVTAALVGGVLRKPLLTILLLFLCFPFHSVFVMAIASIIGSKIPLPKRISESSS
ncbi:MAG: chloride channel protein [Thermoplasmata archaeon]|nr:chloride channel protein [Thermoplasmata archaeon]